MKLSVHFSAEAHAQLDDLYTYIAQAGAPDTAHHYVLNIVECCERLALQPFTGIARPDIRPHLRVTHYKGRVMIAFAVIDAQVAVLGIFYGGMNCEHLLAP